jgi:peptide/nickel transport system substrate-binding protein
MRRTNSVLAAGVALVLASAALTSCTKNSGDSGNGTDDKVVQSGTISLDPKDSLGPAPEVAGAKRGGTLKLITQQDFEHLDPQRTYLVGAMSIQHLLIRTLTQFREDGSGKMALIGDLAETPGKDVNGEYKIKSGIKWEDGREVKAADVAYGIARSFEENIDGGPTYVQEWLADSASYNETYKGPYTSGNVNVPGLTVTGDYGLKFDLKSPHCDLPYALALPTSAAVPQDKDTKAEYDRRIFANGPYKIKEYIKDTRLVLERNPNWDPKTDPLRHDYLDSVVVEMGPDDVAQTERVLAGSGDDAAAVAWDGVPQSLVKQILDVNQAVKDRTLNRPGPFVWYMAINNDRIKDLNVRKAIGCALDKEGILLTQGGDAAGKVTNTLMADSTIGWANYPDPTGCGPKGDPVKAKALLNGQKVKLAFMSRSSAYGQQTAPVVKESLEKAGFEVVTTYQDSTQHNPTARTKGNAYDIYLSNWAADWPSGASTIPVLYDGRKIGPKGNSNVSYFNADDVNAEIDRVSKLSAGEAGPEWAKIDKLIEEKYYPVVPVYQNRTLDLVGSKVGGVFLSDNILPGNRWVTGR